MKSIFAVAAVGLLMTALLPAQEPRGAGWSVYPALTMVRQFPGEQIEQAPFNGPIYTFAPVMPYKFQYQGTGVQLRAKLKRSEWDHLFITVAGGMTSYSRSGSNTYVTAAAMASSYANIGSELYGADFTNYSLGWGAQVYFPESENKNFLLYFGAEGTLNFLNGGITISKQTQLGYQLMGGFDLKPFTFGITYTSFSDIKNIGASFGFRFSSFKLD